MRNTIERRRHPRQYSDSEGMIVIRATRPLPCRIVDRSEGGVRLKVHSVLGIPDAFRVELPATGEVLTLTAAWRKPGEIGARFELPEAA
jgi:hypothetical protein